MVLMVCEMGLYTKVKVPGPNFARDPTESRMEPKSILFESF